MIRVKGRYRNQSLELDKPLALADGTEVDVDVHLAEQTRDVEHRRWVELGMERVEEEWESAEDAVYDDWKRLYGVESR